MGDREYIAKLKEENAQLLEENNYLRAALAINIVPPAEWKLTRQECRVVGCLARHDIASVNLLMTALYIDSYDSPEPKIVSVFISKVRRKLKPFGIAVKNRWGHGYSLDAETRARLTERPA